MGSEQKGHRMHNQLKLLTIKTEKKERKARQHGGKLSDLGGGGWWWSQWNPAKHTAKHIQPSGLMKQSIISKPHQWKLRKRGRDAVSTSLWTEICGWCTAAVMNSAAHWSQAPFHSLSLSRSAQRLKHMRTHTCTACSYLHALNAEEHCFNVIATTPILSNLTFTMCHFCYIELFAHSSRATSGRTYKSETYSKKDHATSEAVS